MIEFGNDFHSLTDEFDPRKMRPAAADADDSRRSAHKYVFVPMAGEGRLDHQGGMAQAAPSQVPPNIANQLAWMNTILGLQRTLMAAERTAVALIAFGFTVAQLFESLKSEVPRQLLALGPHVPRDVGLLMIAAGVGSLALFVWEYLKAIALLSAGEFAAVAVRARMPLHQLTCTTAYAIMVIGILAFGSVLVVF